MSTTMVCIASADKRTVCDTCCENCAFYKADRRQQHVISLSWDLNERRAASNLVPLEFCLAGPEPGSSVRSNNFLIPLVIIGSLLVFNLLDGILTVRALSLGFREANPLMASLFNFNIPMALLAKISIVAVGAVGLWKLRHLPIAMFGMFLVAGAYGLVVLYHLAYQLTF